VPSFYGFVNGPAFGTGDIDNANSGSGDLVGALFGYYIIVPNGYVSNSPLSDTATYDNATLASLGLTPGTYVWTWGDGTDQSFTLEIG
jgi:hypothetical protein